MSDELSMMRAAEHLLSERYMRIRILVGAFDTNHGVENRFEVTEDKIRALLNARDAAKADHALMQGHLDAANVELTKALNSAQSWKEAADQHYESLCDMERRAERAEKVLRLAAAQNQMCLEHFREADMAEWARACMKVRAAIDSALNPVVQQARP